ncbi:hypothetical protein [Melittangium boletus]|uniref:MlpA n=1 Tax=Melittangium boletus DSM 14713 TaxID=1294270 RepID=A0A250IBN4_9BACT|nr:hypothetical protein [Melittangium boletus]ATB29165.1 MlpA [Melittangium boletus DSM 14713]
MKTQRILAWTLPLGCAAILAACGAEQPAPQCTVGRGDHAVRYTLKSGSGVCAQKTVEIVGAQAFRTPGSGIPPTLALKPAFLLVGSEPETSATSSGDFTTEYPVDNLCEVPGMSEARQTRAGAALSYLWSNLRIQGRAAIPGTQWVADLRYTEGDCTATYEAVGVFPAIKCERQENGVIVRDPAICKQARAGSSLDPAFPIVCEESANLCVLDGQPPALVP